MKVSNVIILSAALMVAMTAIASQEPDKKLWVAIDDGTGNEELFIKLDSDKVASEFDDIQVTDLRILQAVAVDHVLQTDTITIISNKVLDDTTKEKIETVLSSSGHIEDVVFVDRNGISSKEVSATN